MSKVRRKTAKPVPPKAHQTAQPINPAPLPLPGVAEPTPVTSLTPIAKAKRIDTRTWQEKTILPSNSIIRQKVLQIVALKLQGLTYEEMAPEIGLKVSSIRTYMHLAGKNGWLAKHAIDPTDRLQYELTHKVVRNLDEMLDSKDEERRDVATLKTAEGMLFKQLAEQTQQAPMAMIGIRIEMPAGANQTIREDTGGGTPRYEIVDGGRVDVGTGPATGSQ